mmetsp:Transcript_16343/g.24638  ORF Transcript_16343/g.24638 Transcript_16343/m.24638 type:complete len:286 (-) Transcript_16343:137-994(-)|eukprot:CAMPEP_0185026364 /NCGR_PEP_ID=MMETSP1103-20130426/10410_1 /TAXON_ID=36769 /ORGANISM="Paraphysomonas bandaiensis, Strain Caron Lab Isolate" /LENGTH=285 /DNA_ID=CAMNT_0027559921 /DNA_START=16 /DNA_END=873 /DNA_ORIENTATION=+
MSLYYKNLEYKINGLLEDDYFYTKKVDLKTTNASGIEWSAAGVISPTGTVGSFSARWDNPLGFTLENFRVKTDGRVLAEASLKVAEGLKFTSSIEDGRQEPGKPLRSYGKLGLDFLSDYVSVQGDVDIVNGPIVSSSILGEYEKFKFGGDVFLDTHFEDREQRPELMDASIGASYDGPDWTASLRTTDLMSNVRLAYVHHVSDSLDVGGLVEYRIKSNYQSLAVGSRWIPDEQTVVKGKMNSDAVFAASLRQKVSDYLHLIVCAEVDAKETGHEGHKFGLGMEFE